jgi:hypothetical protein
MTAHEPTTAGDKKRTTDQTDTHADVHAVVAEFSGFPLDDVPVTVERRTVWTGDEHTPLVDVTIGDGDAEVTATFLEDDADALADALRGAQL